MALSAGKLFKRVGKILLHLPQDVIGFLWAKICNVMSSAKMAEHYVPLHLPRKGFQFIKMSLIQQMKTKPSQESQQNPYLKHCNVKQYNVKQYNPASTLPAQEQQTVERIHHKTVAGNRNNLTRTQAYYEFYRENPEVHWAFLAHMVSRNGGWNMTDLKGDLLPHIMDSGQTEHLYLFLEWTNALIFQDAYPQLLLYVESRKINRNLFHLLSSFHVSQFMKIMWDYFWQNRQHSALLTVALIINEQNYIEKRVVQDALFKKNVIETLLFQLQASMQLTQVIFPYASGLQSRSVKLAGLILEDFSDLHERIEFGKKLYAILFGFPEILNGALSFAARAKHSGSRADYWPQLFGKHKSSSPSSVYTKKLKGHQLAEGASPLYSPELMHAWKDHPVPAAEPYDWCVDTSCLTYLKSLSPPFSIEMAEEHCLSLNAVEYYILAKTNL